MHEAEELLRLNRLPEAAAAAESVYKAFPEKVEALIILGRIEISAGNKARARSWFRLASAVNPRHPLVKTYQKLFEQYEHRRGMLNPDISPLPEKSPRSAYQSAISFKRAWFSPLPPYMFSKVNVYLPELASAPEPNIIHLAGVDLEIDEELDSRFQDALDALDEGRFLQAYIFFDDLIMEYSGRIEYKLGKADAAIQMGRMAEARAILNELYMQNPYDSSISEAYQNIGISEDEVIFSPKDPVNSKKTRVRRRQ
ncbi:MAG: tetratricopeptide repeat protein [Candidatus Riflebacteria bacterium]|nr:tetratricopeptide repeat protein [Candidatus Riflebacteria bacterium]